MNPLLLKLLPYAVVATLAFGAAWQIQALRITAVQQELTSYQQSMREAVVAAREHEQIRQKETVDAWNQNLVEYRRRIAAGWVPKLPAATGTGLALPAAGRAYGAGESPVPAAPGAEEACRVELRQVTNDCALDVLQINALQADIEKQPDKR